MAKGQDKQKSVKKKSEKTLKEKRAEKKQRSLKILFTKPYALTPMLGVKEYSFNLPCPLYF